MSTLKTLQQIIFKKKGKRNALFLQSSEIKTGTQPTEISYYYICLLKSLDSFFVLFCFWPVNLTTLKSSI